MLFDFPLNERLFLALARQSAAPIREALSAQLQIPDTCTWATFLRLHDEVDLSGLSVAEGRVLRLLTSGLSNLEISQELAVSTETVKTHVKRILAKLGVSSRSKAARVAHEAWRHRR